MGRKSKIAIAVSVLVVALAAAGAYAYDNAHKDEIAAGVRIAGVDVGGLSAARAEAKVRAHLLEPLKRPVTVTFGKRSWSLPASRLKARADVGASVRSAVEASQGGGLPDRLVRYATSGDVEKAIPLDVSYSHSAINRFVRHVAEELDSKPVDASVEPSGGELLVVASEPGRKVRDNALTKKLERAARSAGGRHVKAVVHETRPEVTTKEVASRYPSYLTLDRASFTLRLWKDLKLAKSYTVAVGQEGLETPEGLYQIEAKEENPTWYVPESAWAGDLAGETIPPGPDNPIKARWMAIYEGAGIHGTEETESLGSAASHGCVRMSIPDVEELYDQVEVGTPIFIG